MQLQNCHDGLNTGAAGAAAALELQRMIAPSDMRMRCAPAGGSSASQWGPVKPEGQVQPLLPTQLPPLVQYQPPLHSTTLTLQLSPLQWQCQHCHPKDMFLAGERSRRHAKQMQSPSVQRHGPGARLLLPAHLYPAGQLQ